MPTPIFNTGSEHGLSPTTAGPMWDGNTGTPTTVAGTRTGGPGAYLLRCSPVAEPTYVVRGESLHTTHVERLYWRYTGSLPAANSTVFHMIGNLGDLDKIGVTLKADGNLVASVYDGSGASYTEFGSFAVSAGTWYRIDFRTVLVGLTSHTLSWSIDGVAQTGGVFSTAVTMTGYNSHLYGPWETTTVVYEYDDIISSATNADYPIGAGGCVAVYVSQDLAAEHQSITLSDWTFCDAIPAAGTTFASQTETDSRSRINNFTTTTGIKVGLAGAPAGFTRWPLATAAFLSDPNAVRGYVMQMQESAGADNIQWRISLGGGSTSQIYNASLIGVLSMEVQQIQLTRPGGGNWAVADLATLKFEGDSTDAAPGIYLAGMTLEIDAPPDPEVGGNPVPFPPRVRVIGRR